VSIKNLSLGFLPRTNTSKYELLIKCLVFRSDALGSWSRYVKSLIYLSFILLSVSCATVLPVSAEAEFPAVYTVIENINPQWQKYADGVGYFHCRIESPRLEFWALRVDLSLSNISIVTRSGALNSGSGTLSTKVTSFVRDNNLIAGINALPFDIISSAEGQPIKNLGIVISDGVLLSPVNRYYDALVFYRADERQNNGTITKSVVRAAIVSQSSIISAENIENAVGGFHKILADGEPAQRTLNNDIRHPRSAAGVSANGDFLYLLVVDGRRAGSVGSTERETAAILASLGSHNGINFDGGGSSALAMRLPDGNVKAVNTPIHFFPGQERAVAGCIGIRVE